MRIHRPRFHALLHNFRLVRQRPHLPRSSAATSAPQLRAKSGPQRRAPIFQVLLDTLVIITQADRRQTLATQTPQ
jgi:hypothetical protein